MDFCFIFTEFWTQTLQLNYVPFTSSTRWHDPSEAWSKGVLSDGTFSTVICHQTNPWVWAICTGTLSGRALSWMEQEGPFPPKAHGYLSGASSETCDPSCQHFSWGALNFWVYCSCGLNLTFYRSFSYKMAPGQFLIPQYVWPCNTLWQKKQDRMRTQQSWQGRGMERRDMMLRAKGLMPMASVNQPGSVWCLRGLLYTCVPC